MAVKENIRVKNLIALSLRKSIYTIERWIDGNDSNLTKAAALKVIKEELKLSDKQILEEEPIGTAK